ncbi:MAG TPA: oligosaccharide flippase family protein [Methanobacteriaceae archaeon]|nr:oligosaccharide flippase family protein [Methanobacteriaceae archaeon]
MSVARRIAKNTTLLLIASIISYLLGFFTTIYSARYLGAGEFGVLSLALALTGIFGVITDLGLGTLTVREVARDKSLKDKYFFNTLIMKVLLSFLTMGLMVVTVNIIGYPQTIATVIYIITGSVLIGSFSSVFSSIFQAYEKMEYLSLSTVLNSILLFAGVLLAIHYKMDIIVFAILYFIISLFILVYSVSVYKLNFSFSELKIDWSFWEPTMKEALPFGVAAVFVTVFYWIDSIMLSVMVNNEVVGWYNAAYKLIFVFLSFYAVYITSIFPVMAGFFKTSKTSLKFAYERSFKYMIIISVPLAVGTTLLADKIILFIYGTDYLPAIVVLQVLVWTVVFMFLNGVSGNLLGSINKQPSVTKILAIGVTLNIVLNLILIPKFSYVGSAAATVVTELVILPFYLYILLKTEYAEINNLLKDIPKILFSNLVMVVVIIFLRDVNLILLIFFSALVYFATIYLTKSFDEHDLDIFRGLVRRKNG